MQHTKNITYVNINHCVLNYVYNNFVGNDYEKLCAYTCIRGGHVMRTSLARVLRFKYARLKISKR